MHLPSAAALSSLIVREGEAEAIVHRLQASRLVTLIGPGGVGKTRLALRVLVSAADAGSPVGARIAALDEKSDERLLVRHFASAIGLVGSSRVLKVEDLAQRLGEQRLLLLIDGCDWLRPACATLVEQLLQTAPGLRVLATSLEPLGVPGEQCWPVAPLGVPRIGASFAEIARAAGVRLFVNRLSAQRPDFKLNPSNAPVVASICQSLDGLPLALELAASQAALLGLEQLASLISTDLAVLTSHQRGSPARHLSVYDTVARGWMLLTGNEQRLLRRLAVFVGGWTLAGAEHVCTDDALPKPAILDVLNRLIARSSVAIEPGHRQMRYRMLNTVRSFALDRLAEAGELEGFRQRHLQWYIELAETRWTAATASPDAAELESELDNVRAALEWATGSGTEDEGLRLAVVCWPVWVYRGHALEGRAWLTRLTSTPRSTDLARQAEAACLAAGLAGALGDTNTAVHGLARAARLARQCGDVHLEARAQRFQGEMHLRRADFGAARRALESAEQLLGSWGDPLAVHVQARLAVACLEQGELSAARQHASLALTRAEASRADGLLAWAWEVAGALTYRQQALDESAAAFDQAITYARRGNRTQTVAAASIGLARVHVDRHELGRARGLLTELLGLARDPSLHWLCPQIFDLAAELAAPDTPARAMRLDAAASAWRARTGSTAWPSEMRRRDTWLRHLHSEDCAGASPAESFDEERAFEEAHRVAHASRERSAVQRGDGGRAGARDSRQLSVRERQVAELLARGLTNRAIAELLLLSEGTVRGHVGHVLHKLGLRSRVQVRRALGTGFDHVRD